jgi:hypothetical protein
MERKERDMSKIVRFMVRPLAGILALAAFGAIGLAQEPPDPIGYQFLDRLVITMIKAVAPGGEPSNLDQDILLLSKELKAAREAKKVDDLFAIRYSRLLSAVRQAVTQDPGVLYWPMYRFHMIEFIEERTGQLPDWDDLVFMVNDHGGSGVGLGAISDALMSEVVSLHIHLENQARRPEILKNYLEKGMKGMGEVK